MKAVNLLPSDQKGAAPKAKPAVAAAEPSGGAGGAFAVLGALAFAVLATASYVLVGNTIKDREAELARVQADTQVVQTQLVALKPYAEFQTIAAQRVTTVTQLAGGRFDWDQALRDLSRAMPSDVRLKSLKGSLSSALSSGNALRGSRPAPAIELAGCADSQSDVARLMSRLRIVRGVTRVALSKSERPAAAADGAASATTEALLCGKGRPPAFEVVVFFERAEVTPTTIVPGSPAPAAATAAPSTPGTSTPPAGTTAPPASGTPATTPTTTGVSAP